MGKIIRLRDKTRELPDNLITKAPWEFRRAEWQTSHFIQISRHYSEKLQRQRTEICRQEDKGILTIPSHHILKGGLAYTIRAVFACRENEEKMREVYYFIGLMDCMINQVNPILRTDLVRALYKKVFAMKETFNIHWYGPLDQVLLPIDSRYYNSVEYRSSLKTAQTMKDLYLAIRKGTDKMFDILSLKYVFYCPGMGE